MSDRPNNEGPKVPRLAVRQALFALSGNICAFPDCDVAMYTHGTIIGEICHIHAQKAGEARFRDDLNLEEIHALDNLVLMCRNHHKVIDDHPDKYTADWLRNVKRAHELTAPNTPTDILVQLDVDSRLDHLRDRMPELLQEMQNDVGEDESKLIREFVILRRGNVFSGTKTRFTYYEDDHENLILKIDLLEEYDLVRDVRGGSDTSIYRFEEDFWNLLAERSGRA